MAEKRKPIRLKRRLPLRETPEERQARLGETLAVAVAEAEETARVEREARRTAAPEMPEAYRGLGESPTREELINALYLLPSMVESASAHRTAVDTLRQRERTRRRDNQLWEMFPSFVTYFIARGMSLDGATGQAVWRGRNEREQQVVTSTEVALNVVRMGERTVMDFDGLVLPYRNDTVIWGSIMLFAIDGPPGRQLTQEVAMLQLQDPATGRQGVLVAAGNTVTIERNAIPVGVL